MRMMPNWSQEDYDERKKRQNDGLASDDDRRLIKQYEGNGFRESRLLEQDAAAERARAARSGAHAREETEPGQLHRPGVNDKLEEWVAYALAINERLPEDHRPISDPESAKKGELVAFYKDIETPV